MFDARNVRTIVGLQFRMQDNESLEVNLGFLGNQYAMACGTFNFEEGDYIVNITQQYNETVTTAVQFVLESGRKINSGIIQYGESYKTASQSFDARLPVVGIQGYS